MDDVAFNKFLHVQIKGSTNVIADAHGLILWR